jgi:hypothetical protein
MKPLKTLQVPSELSFCVQRSNSTTRSWVTSNMSRMSPTNTQPYRTFGETLCMFIVSRYQVDRLALPTISSTSFAVYATRLSRSVFGFALLQKLIEEDSQSYLEDANYTSAWESLISLLDKPYWTRVWILQETAINPNVLLKFGASSSKQQIAVSFLSEWDNIRFEVLSKWRELHPDAGWEGSMMQKFDAISNNVYNMGHLPPLVPLTADKFQPLLQCQICNGPLASNPLDYVYGIIGLFDTPILPVDYSLSPRDLFLKVVEIVQHRSRKLDFLSWAWGNYAQDSSIFPNQHSIPRWCIDFSYQRDLSGQSPSRTHPSHNASFGIHSIMRPAIRSRR